MPYHLLMADKSMDQLRALLKSYEERTAKLQGAVKPVQDEGEPRRRACGERLKTVVRGVLERFMDALKNAGHEAAIEDRTDSADAYPSVTLAFTPRLRGGGGAARHRGRPRYQALACQGPRRHQQHGPYRDHEGRSGDGRVGRDQDPELHRNGAPGKLKLTPPGKSLRTRGPTARAARHLCSLP